MPLPVVGFDTQQMRWTQRTMEDCAALLKSGVDGKLGNTLVKILGDFQLQLSFIRRCFELVELLHSLLPNVVQLADRVIKRWNLLFLQVLRSLCHHL